MRRIVSQRTVEDFDGKMRVVTEGMRDGRWKSRIAPPSHFIGFDTDSYYHFAATRTEAQRKAFTDFREGGFVPEDVADAFEQELFGYVEVEDVLASIA